MVHAGHTNRPLFAARKPALLPPRRRSLTRDLSGHSMPPAPTNSTPHATPRPRVPCERDALAPMRPRYALLRIGRGRTHLVVAAVVVEHRRHLVPLSVVCHEVLCPPTHVVKPLLNYFYAPPRTSTIHSSRQNGLRSWVGEPAGHPHGAPRMRACRIRVPAVRCHNKQRILLSVSVLHCRAGRGHQS